MDMTSLLSNLLNIGVDIKAVAVMENGVSDTEKDLALYQKINDKVKWVMIGMVI